MRIQNRIKRSTRQYIIVAFICLTVIGGAAFLTTIILTGQIREEYQILLKETSEDMKSNQKNVYVTVADINAGEAITVDKLEMKKVYSSQPQSLYITTREVGKLALIDIPTGTQVLNTMVTDNLLSSGLREMEYDVVYINSNIINNDTVDIRIFYPNGESYVVLSKKNIKDIVADTVSIFLWLDEEELLRMSAAIVDAGLYTGSRLFVTKYIEPSIQEASVITYTPSLSILSLIENDPNIIKRCSQELNKDVRKALENRLASNADTDVSSISWDVPSDSFVSPQSNNEDINQENDNGINDGVGEEPDEDSSLGNELGSSDFIYYAEEEAAKDGDIEYGE